MSKSDWIKYVAAPLILTWAIDRVTKLAALNLVGLKLWGPFGLTLHYNPGAILGLFADLPPVLRIVSLSTGGAFLIFMFIIIQFLLPLRSPLLRSGMSILLGGILGNVADRIWWGEIVDFLLIAHNNWYSPVFNMADALQWIGYIMIVIALIRDGSKIWPEDNLRKSFIIDLKYQLTYCTKLVSFGFAFAMIAGIFSFTFLKVALEDYSTAEKHIELSHILTPFIITYAILSLAFLIILFFTGLVLSHRAAGPIFAFQRFLEELLDGKDSHLKFRTGDDFSHLEEVAEKMSKRFQNMPKNQSTDSLSDMNSK